MYRTVHRPAGRAAVGGLVLALGVVGAATVPTASGATSAAAGEPKVIEVTTDTPLGDRDAAPPGRPGQPRSVLRRAARRLPHHHHRMGRLTDQRLPDQGRLRRREGRLRRVAVRRPARRRGTARRVRPPRSARPRRRPPARGLRTKVVERARTARAAAEARAPRRAPGTGNGPQPGLVILVSFANQASVGSTEDQWAQDFFGAGSSVYGYYQATASAKFALVPAAESAGVANNGVVGWLQLPYDHPNFGNDYDASETKLGRRRRHGRRPVRRLRVLRHQQGRLAQRLRAARHGDRGGLRDVVRRRGQRLRQQRVGSPGRPARLGAEARRHRRQPLRRHDVRRVDVHAQQRARPEVDDRGHGPRDGSRHRLPRPLRHRPHQRGRVQVERDVDRQLEPGRHGLLRDHPGRDGRVLEVLPGLAGADPRRRGRSTAPRCRRRRPAPRPTGWGRTPTTWTGSSRCARARASTSSSRTGSWSAGTPASPPAA